MRAIKRYLKRRKLLNAIRSEVREAERADLIYELIRFDLEEVERINTITFGQYQLVSAALLATVSRHCSNRSEAQGTFKRIIRHARALDGFDRSKEAA